MLKKTELSVILASRVDDNEVIGIRGAIGWLDISRKSIKSKNQTKNGHLDNSNDLKKSKILNSKSKETFNCLR